MDYQLDSFSLPDEEDRRKVGDLLPHMSIKTPEDIQEQARILIHKDRERAVAIELVISYANDLVKMWPAITIRTLSTVTKKIADLKEALELAKR